MNLALHGFLLQVLVSILFQHGFLLCSAGEPGYLDFDNLPETNFSCQGKVIGGYYADVEAGCQMFHVCTIGQKDEIMDIKFLCLNGTVFDQETRVCERVDEVDCSKSERFYNLNLELYGNNAVTLSLHENSDDEENSSDSLEDHQQRTTSARPATTTTASTTTIRPNKPSTATPNSAFQNPAGYPQHFQPQPPFPQVHTSQSKSLYDDKNGGYHHQYIFHNGERNNNQATSFQLFSNQGVSSTTVQVPQIHQIRFSPTPSPQILHNEPPTITPLYHTSSTIQTLLNGNNGPAIINPIFHNHGIASTTEQFTVHSNNPRETSEYLDNGEREQSIRPLEAIQSTNQGKVSKLTISPVPTPQEPSRIIQTKISQHSQQQQRLQGNFLPTPATVETTVRSFYPTPRTSAKPTSSNGHITHIHVSPVVPIPQLKPHQITLNLPPPDIQRIVQNPSPLLPSQSRVIVTAKASVSDESGRPLNTSQLVTLPLPTIPASYDEYKEGDESFDPFYRDVPKIRTTRSAVKTDQRATSTRSLRRKRSPDMSIGRFHYSFESRADSKLADVAKERPAKDTRADNDEVPYYDTEIRDLGSIKANLMKFRHILFGGDLPQDSVEDTFETNGNDDNEELRKVAGKTMKRDEVGTIEANSVVQKSNITSHRATFVKDLQVKATKHLPAVESDDDDYEIDENDSASNADQQAQKDGEIYGNLSFDESDPEKVVDREIDEENDSYVEDETAEKTISSEENDDERNVSPTRNTVRENSDIESETTTVLNNLADNSAEKHDGSQHSLEGHGTGEREGILAGDDTKEEEAIAKGNTEPGIVIDLKLLEPAANISNGKDADFPVGPKLNPAIMEIFVPLGNENDQNEGRNTSVDNDATEIASSELTTVFPESDNVVELRGRPRVAAEKVESITEKLESDGENLGTTEASVKYSARKKSGRRSSRRRISSRTKLREENADRITKTTPAEIPEETETSTTSIVQFEREIDELIGGRIFEELESQTTKELDTRAVGQTDAKYFKNLEEEGRKNGKHNGLDRNEVRELSKGVSTLNLWKDQGNSEKLRAHIHEATTAMSIDLPSTKKNESEFRDEDVEEMEDEKQDVGESEGKDNDKSPEDKLMTKEKPQDENVKTEENPTEPMKDVVISEKMDKYFIEYQTAEEEVDQHSAETPKESPASADMDEHVDDNSHDSENKEIEVSEEAYSARVNLSENSELPDHESRSGEEYASSKNDESSPEEASAEYNDRSAESSESAQDNSAEDDYAEFDDPEDSTISVEHSNSEQTSDSRENESIEKSAKGTEATLADGKGSTEGVLKFTDELPKTDGKDDAVEKTDSSESIEDSVQDYVDDNYEPENYREQEMPTTLVNPSDEELKKFTLDDKDTKKERLDHLFENQRMKDEDKVTSAKEDSSTESKIVKKDHPESDEESEDEEMIENTESTTSTYEPTTETVMTTPTTTTTTTIKTTKRTTTTLRPTSPKLFKSISARRNYNYIPPTTTPNPVIIKPRLPLLNPKPAKPLKSYNDLVPKPVIRRLPLTRKPSASLGTTTTTTTTSTTTTTTERETTIREIEITSGILFTTTESSKSKENILEHNYEPKNNYGKAIDDAAKDNDSMLKSDQVPNSSNTKTLNSPGKVEVKLSNDPLPPDTSTSYSLPKSTLATAIDDVLSETEEYKHAETTEEVTTMNDFESSSVTLVPHTSKHIEEMTDNPVKSEEYATTMSVMSDSKEVTVVPTKMLVENDEPSTVIPSSTVNEDNPDSTSTTPRPRKLIGSKRHPSFNCLEKEMYHFYGDTRDCRLFHYCSPGFTSRQVLDFRFVCEEGTIFDEETQSCRHDVRNRKCHKRPW